MALRNDGVVITPVPVAGRDGELIQDVAHPAMPRPRIVVLFEWESGAEPVGEGPLIEKFEVLGEVTARMHLHSRRWRRPAGLRAPHLGFRDQPRRPAALGPLARRHGPRRGEGDALRAAPSS